MRLVQRHPDTGYLDTWLWVPKKYLNVPAVMSALSYTFTDSYSGQQEVLYLWRETANHLLVPRMLWNLATAPYPIVDCRPQLFEHVPFLSRVHLDHRLNREGQLVPTGRNVQKLSIAALEAAMGGTLQLGCGLGKTVITFERIARDQAPALVVVDNTQLLEQWEREAQSFLTIPGGIGHLSSGKNDWEGRGLVLATYQTLAARSEKLPEAFRRRFHTVYFDEGHHISAPVFSRCASMFYGRRFSLTATPERADGWHVISHFHIGPVLHKDLSRPLTAKICFFRTGLKLDLQNDHVRKAVSTASDDVHLSKVRSYFGSWQARLTKILQDTVDAQKAGRKVLVLSDSIDEVVNLMVMWTRGPHNPLYSHIPYPTLTDIGETEYLPLALSPTAARKLQTEIQKIWDKGVDHPKLTEKMARWRQYLVWQRLKATFKQRRRAFLQQLSTEPSTAGYMTFGVPPKVRQHFLETRDVIFAITKYGKEGLDCPRLDTVLVSSIFSSRNALQQLLGRPTRLHDEKKTPVVVFYVDDVGACLGMEKKLMRHMRSWPLEEGGPIAFEQLNSSGAPWQKTSLKTTFGL